MNQAGVLGERRWSPYVVGALIGVLSWVTFLSMDKALGTSSSLVHAAGLLVGIVSPETVVGPDANPYFAKEISEKTPMIDWQVMLVVGLGLGAWISSRLSGDRVTECVPPLWRWRFGDSKAVRYTAAFLAGTVMAFGARMAGGCTSGHGISGGLQLAVSSWLFVIGAFGAGIPTAFLMFGKEGRRHVHD